MGAGGGDVPRGAGPRHGRVTEAPSPRAAPCPRLRPLISGGPAGRFASSGRQLPALLARSAPPGQTKARAGEEGWGEGREPRAPAPAELRRRRDKGAGPRRAPEADAPFDRAGRPGRAPLAPRDRAGSSGPRWSRALAALAPQRCVFAKCRSGRCRVSPSPRILKSSCRVVPSGPPRPSPPSPPRSAWLPAVPRLRRAANLRTWVGEGGM